MVVAAPVLSRCVAQMGQAVTTESVQIADDIGHAGANQTKTEMPGWRDGRRLWPWLSASAGRSSVGAASPDVGGPRLEAAGTRPRHRPGKNRRALRADAAKGAVSAASRSSATSNTARPTATCSMSSCRRREFSPRPVLIYVHGGAFVGGDKRTTPTSPFYDNIMLWAVKNGFVGVNATYRLAPQAPWPAGAEDMASVVQWVHGQDGRTRRRSRAHLSDGTFRGRGSRGGLCIASRIAQGERRRVCRRHHGFRSSTS